jgi:plasmid replication initiation protein
MLKKHPPKPNQLLLPIDSPLKGHVQNDRWMMAYQFVHLDRTNRDWPIVYNDGKVEIRVEGDKIATMYDLEILIYVVSLMVEKMERGEEVNRAFRFAAHDFFRVAGIDPGGRSYQRIEEALDRLQATRVRTNIVTGGRRVKEMFSWVADAKFAYDEGTKVLDWIEVTLCEWLWQAVKLDNNRFIYDPRYFDLPPLEKRLYEIARAHCGKTGFRMWLDHLQKRVGSEDLPRRFKAKLKQIASRKNPLPGYAFFIKDCLVMNAGKRGRPSKRSIVIFVRQDVSWTKVLEQETELELVE